MRNIRIQCPNEKCGLELVIRRDFQGQMVRCAGCGHKFLAPPAEISSEKVRKLGRKKAG